MVIYVTVFRNQVSFFCRTSVHTSNSENPIVLRVAYRGERKDIFTDLTCISSKWNTLSQAATDNMALEQIIADMPEESSLEYAKKVIVAFPDAASAIDLHWVHRQIRLLNDQSYFSDVEAYIRKEAAIGCFFICKSLLKDNKLLIENFSIIANLAIINSGRQVCNRYVPPGLLFHYFTIFNFLHATSKLIEELDMYR